MRDFSLYSLPIKHTYFHENWYFSKISILVSMLTSSVIFFICFFMWSILVDCFHWRMYKNISSFRWGARKIIVFYSLSYNLNAFCFTTMYWTVSFMHIRQVLYHWYAFPALEWSLLAYQNFRSSILKYWLCYKIWFHSNFSLCLTSLKSIDIGCVFKIACYHACFRISHTDYL